LPQGLGGSGVARASMPAPNDGSVPANVVIRFVFEDWAISAVIDNRIRHRRTKFILPSYDTPLFA